ncbi:hypothetical protein PCAR4_570022 [Paraburkholderia caribensis]|nr:hypothetical protein PCAR4_570022 [Paraburkholderia caribensis]
MQIWVAGVTVVPAEGHGVTAEASGACTPSRPAAPGGEPSLAHHTSVRRMNATPGGHTRISAFPCR